MGYALMVGACCSCGKTFTFHPNKVPSVRVNGKREPVCESCIKVANYDRQQKGIAPIIILPGAYEPAPEEEVNWEG